MSYFSDKLSSLSVPFFLISDIDRARTRLLLKYYEYASRMRGTKSSGRNACSTRARYKAKKWLTGGTLKFHSRGRAIAAGFSRFNVFKPTIRPLPRARCHTMCHLISAITLLLPIKNRKRHEIRWERDRVESAKRGGRERGRKRERSGGGNGGMDGSNEVGATTAKRHERRRGKKWTSASIVSRSRVHPPRNGGTQSVAAKCREIVILQSQREFTLATGEI